MEEDDLKNNSISDSNNRENDVKLSNNANSFSDNSNNNDDENEHDNDHDNEHDHEIEIESLRENIEKMNETLFQLELKQLKLKTSIANLKLNEDDLVLKNKEISISLNSYNMSIKILLFISLIGLLSGSYFNKMIQTLIK